MKYEKMSHSILAAIGGVENISSVTHCATRLRIDVKKLDAIDLDAVKKAEYALGAVVSGGQLQVIIGPNVTEAYNDFLEVAGIDFGAGVVADDEGTIADMAASVKSNGAVGIVEKFGNITAQIFMPIVPALIVGGLILAIKNLLVNYCGFSTDSGTAQVLLAIFDAAFTFLPVWIGYQLASILKMQPIMGALLGAIMVSCSCSRLTACCRRSSPML